MFSMFTVADAAGPLSVELPISEYGRQWHPDNSLSIRHHITKWNDHLRIAFSF